MIPLHLKRVPVCIRPEYTILYERIIGHTFTHCNVTTRWTKETKRKLRDDFEALCGLVSPEPLWALHTVGDEKHRKFIEMFGFEYVRELEDGRAVYKKETNGRTIRKQSETDDQ